MPNLIFSGSSGQCGVGRIIQMQQSIPPPHKLLLLQGSELNTTALHAPDEMINNETVATWRIL